MLLEDPNIDIVLLASRSPSLRAHNKSEMNFHKFLSVAGGVGRGASQEQK